MSHECPVCRERDNVFAVVIAILFVMMFLVSFACGMHGTWAAETRLRGEAIEAGVAEWRIDPKTGERSFHWKKRKE